MNPCLQMRGIPPNACFFYHTTTHTQIHARLDYTAVVLLYS